MSEALQAAAVAVVAAQPAAPRWPTWLQAIVGVVGTTFALMGAVLFVGGLLNRVDVLERDMVTVKANQATYIPVLVGMQTDIKYLADSRRRDDSRGDHPRLDR